MTFLKALAVMGLTLVGVFLTTTSWSFPRDPFGLSIGVALLVGALIAFVTWFWRRV